MCLGSVQQLIYAAPPCPEERLHKVTRCWSTPAPVPKADFDRRFGLHLIPGGGYGSTDAGWVVVPQWDHPGGIVLPHYEVTIFDENDDLLPPGEDGEMVSGFEVEEGALSHQGIEDAAAIGVPAALGEEDIRLFVTLKPRAGLTEKDIRAHCRSVMAKFMVPAIVTILEDMPRTVTGKPENDKLAAMPA